MSVATLSKVAALFCALNFKLGVAFTVTPEPPTTVTCPAPLCTKSIDVPIAYATLDDGGTVNVIAPALLSVTSFPASVKTVVYVVPVCALSKGSCAI